MSNPSESSYGRILKSTTVLGTASLINVGLSVVRTKVLAVKLGPGPFGEMGLYQSFLAILGAVAGLGLGQSAVRMIATAAGAGDPQEVSHSIKTLRRLVWITGLLGMFMTLAVAWRASQWTFDDRNHVIGIAVLSLTVLLGQLSIGQTALLQGLRRVRNIATANVVGAALSTLGAVVTIVLFRERAVIPFMVAVAVGTLAATWWFASRVPTVQVHQSWRDTLHRSRELLGFGVSLLLAGLTGMLANYLIRVFMRRETGEAGVGLYQAAFTLSSTYVGFVLGAMGTDYYPRLTAACNDRSRRNRLVNEQTEIALLLGVPGLVLAVLLAGPIIWAFYSTKFVASIALLRWTVLGDCGRLISWPMGFILLASGDRRGFLCSEVIAQVIHLGLVVFLVQHMGLNGGGMAFAGLYAVNSVLVYGICRWRHGFRYRPETIRIIQVAILLMSVSLGVTFIQAPWWRYSAGAVVFLVACAFSLSGLYTCFGREAILSGFRRVCMVLPLGRRLLTGAISND